MAKNRKKRTKKELVSNHLSSELQWHIGAIVHGRETPVDLRRLLEEAEPKK